MRKRRASPFRRILAVLAATVVVAAKGPALADSSVPVRAGCIPVIGVSQLFVLDREGWAKDRAHA